jgi:hypothetical protein
MIEYSDVYEKFPQRFHGNNPSQYIKPVSVHFNIKLLNRKLTISINNDKTLEDLYLCIYNAVYPEFSTERNFDTIPPPGTSQFPKLYHVAVNNVKLDKLENIPIHKFITISSYMKSNPDYFVSATKFGKKNYTIYVIDEYAISNLDKHMNQKNKSFLETIFSCYYR